MVDACQAAPGFPNFFIIGAPKSGTTSLSEYLRRHPDVGFSDHKEPHYFNDDFSHRDIDSLSEYMNCFAPDSLKKPAIGEGSVFYLSSKTAVPNILRHVPDAKFIVMLRNPVDAVYSWYWQAVHSFGEDMMSFEEAWNAQEDRAQGKRLPKHNRVREALCYGALFKYGDQLERLYDRMPRQRVKVILFDEFRIETNRLYAEALEFLGVTQLQLDEYRVMNAGKTFRYPFLEAVANCVGTLKQTLGIRHGFGGMTRLKAWNVTYEKRPPLTDTFTKQLREYYRSDVLKTAGLIQRDLTTWLDGVI